MASERSTCISLSDTLDHFTDSALANASAGRCRDAMQDVLAMGSSLGAHRQACPRDNAMTSRAQNALMLIMGRCGIKNRGGRRREMNPDVR
jgi:hypothetical protein